MARERGLNGDLCRLEIARLPDHDAVGVLPQKCAQDARERETDRFVHRHLHDPFEIVLDRLLRGEQFGIDRVDLAQTGIKRRRFSRTGRAGRDENSIRPLDDFENVIVDVVGHAQHLQIQIDCGAIEHAQNQALAELRRQS